jgi:hypothetical protein
MAIMLLRRNSTYYATLVQAEVTVRLCFGGHSAILIVSAESRHCKYTFKRIAGSELQQRQAFFDKRQKLFFDKKEASGIMGSRNHQNYLSLLSNADHCSESAVSDEPRRNCNKTELRRKWQAVLEKTTQATNSRHNGKPTLHTLQGILEEAAELDPPQQQLLNGSCMFFW